MAKFEIEWTEEVWYRKRVEADSKEDAMEKFWAGELDIDSSDSYGGEVQDSIEIMEVS